MSDKPGINWEEEFAKLDDKFKKDVEEFGEIDCYFLINMIGGMCSRMNRDLAHDRVNPDPAVRVQIDKGMYEMRVKQVYTTLQLTRFGLENPTKGIEENYVPTDDYWRWYNWWNEYAQNELSVSEWSVLEEKMNKREDVSEYRPAGDWRNSGAIGNNMTVERLKKLGV